MSHEGDDQGELFPEVERVLPRRRIARKRGTAHTEAREFGGWTLNKLELLRLYLKMYGRVAGSGTYIDGFAGTGSVNVDGRSSPGSARIAIRSGAFRDHWLFELDPSTFDLLSFNLRYFFSARRRRHTIKGDFNTEIVTIIENGEIPIDKPCFAFLDPNSTQLPWSTVERLATFKLPAYSPPEICKTELWILFNSHQAFARLRHPNEPIDVYMASGAAAALDRIMGGRDAWWDLFEAHLPIGAYAQRYADRLQDVLGYGFSHMQLINDPKTGAPQYYMIHASDHEAAADFMRWSKKTSDPKFTSKVHLPGFT